MKKKMIAFIAIALAVVCGVGGYLAIQQTRQNAADNEKISSEMAKIEDNVVIREGAALPAPEETFRDTTMIDKNSIKADIKEVDVTVPGTYEVEYTFNDIKGQSRSKTVSYTVEANLLDHVDGLSDIQVDYGENLPPVNAVYDEYIESVERDDSMVDNETPGEYTVTYSILGKDGNIETVEKKATVFDTRPAPTPTPIPEKKDNDNIFDVFIKNKDKELERVEASDGEEVAEEPAEENEQEEIPETGNVDMPENDRTVLTGDDTNIAPIVVILISSACIVAAAVFFLVKKKKR